MRHNKSIYFIVGGLMIAVYGFYYFSKTVNHKQPIDLIPTENQDVDSFRLMRIMYACDCPHWVDYKKYIDYKADTSVNKKGFDYYFNDSYYIERHGARDYPDDRNGMVIDFFGKLDTTRRLSKEPIYMDSYPIKGKVIMYSRYKIIDKGISQSDYPPDYRDSTDLGLPENQ